MGQYADPGCNREPPRSGSTGEAHCGNQAVDSGNADVGDRYFFAATSASYRVRLSEEARCIVRITVQKQHMTGNVEIEGIAEWQDQGADHCPTDTSMFVTRHIL